MTLKDHYFHCISAENEPFSLYFQLDTRLWFILKDISQKIQLAANALLDPFDDLSGTIDPDPPKHISEPSPAILIVKNYTQNLLIISSNNEELQRLFKLVQKVGLDGAYWLETTREHCMEAGNNLKWYWSEYGNELTYLGSIPKLVNCGYIESIPADEDMNKCKVLVLHHVYSMYAQEHPDFDPFILPNEEPIF